MLLSWNGLPSSSNAETFHACLPGQYASTSSFCAEVSVGEPSSDSGIRGLSTNFAFLRGAKEKGKRREAGKRKKKRETKREVMSKRNSKQQMETLS